MSLLRRAAVALLALSIAVGPGGLDVYAATLPPVILPPASVTIADESACNPCPFSDGVNSIISAISLYFQKNSPGLAGLPIYNSANLSPSIWGIGWISDIDRVAAIDANGSVTLVDDSGARLTFTESGGAGSIQEYRAPIGTHLHLIGNLSPSNSLSSLSVRDSEGTELLFATPVPASVNGTPIVPGATSAFRATRLTDRNGNTVDYKRDPQGRLTKVVDVHGRYFTMTYDSAGFVATVSDSGGRSASFFYDAAGRKTSETGPEGTVTYLYDANHRLIRITFPNGGIRNFTYDSQGKLASQDDGDGVNALTYTRHTSSTVITDALGKQTVYEYTTNRGFTVVTKITDAAGQSVTFEYDDDLNITSAQDELGRKAHYSFDARGNVISIRDAAGNVSRASYDPNFNRPKTLTNPLNRSVQFDYNAKGDLIQVRDPLNSMLTLSHDAFGHIVSAKDPLGGTTSIAYDSNGAPIAVTDELGRTTTMERDSTGRLTSILDPRDKRTTLNYDAAGNVLQIKNALNGITAIAYESGRDGGRLPSTITDAKGHTTTLNYDLHGRVTSIRNALEQTTTVDYNDVGAPISVQNRNGSSLSIAYDDLHRVSGLTLPEGGVGMTYDAVGNMTSASHYNGSALGMTYDSLNRPTQVVQTLPNGFNYLVRYTYDAAGNRTSMITPQGTFRYSYDALNRVTSITNPYNQTIAFAYDALSRRKSMTYPNGTITTYSYDASGRMTQVSHKKTSSQTTFAFNDYAYDANDNVVGVTDGEGTHTYEYDALNRLTTASHPEETSLPIRDETFSYDAVGNRLSDAERSGYAYDAANRLISDSSFTYTYDANGNMTGRTELASGTTTTFVYNSSDQLIRVEASTYTLASYKYDIAGKRVEKNVGGMITRYVYDGPNVLAILDGNNNLLQLMTQGPGVDLPLITRKNGMDYYFHADALGSITTLTSSNGQPIERIAYLAYGRSSIRDANGQPLSASTVGNTFLFAGRERDGETGLYYNRARYLDVDIGRFTREDPLPGVNQYIYALNNPLLLKDPFGLSACSIIGNFILGAVEGLAFVVGLAILVALFPALIPILAYAGLILALPALFIIGSRIHQYLQTGNYDDLAHLLGTLVGSFGGGALAKLAFQNFIRVAGEAAALPRGSFSIIDWSGYPKNIPRPTGPFRLLEGAEYAEARAAATQANRAMHNADPALKGLDIHEIQPVKFGGSPTDPLNKVPLTRPEHTPVTTWWLKLQRALESK